MNWNELAQVEGHMEDNFADRDLAVLEKVVARKAADSKKNSTNSTAKIKQGTTTEDLKMKAQVKMMPAESNPDLMIPT